MTFFWIIDFLVALISPLLIVSFLIFLAFRGKKRPVSSVAKKASGDVSEELSHIDYLLQALDESKVEGTITRETYAPLKDKYEKRKEQLLKGAVATQPVLESKPSTLEAKSVKQGKPLTLAEITRWLLYLGVFLIFVATIIFAIYKWQTFSEVVKFLILLAVTFLFYLSGWLVKDKLKIVKGGLALVVVGAIMTFFDGYIYLNANNLLEDYLAWALAFLLFALVYLAVAFLVRHRLLVYLSGISQALVVVLVGIHYLNLSSTQIQAEMCLNGTLIVLIALAFLWFGKEVLISHLKNYEDLFVAPLFYLSQALALLTLTIYIFFSFDHFYRGEVAWQTFALGLFYDSLIIAFYALNCWLRKKDVFLYPISLAQIFAFNFFLLFFKVSKDYFALLFVFLALVWLAIAAYLKSRKSFKILEKPLANSSYALAGLVSFGFLSNVLGTLSLSREITTLSNILTFFALSTFYCLAVLEDKKVYPLMYLSLFFFSGFSQLVFMKAGIKTDYIALPMALLSFVYLGGGVIFWRKELKEIGKTYLHSAYAISVYSLLLGFSHQPTLIAVLLINAIYYFVLAFVASQDELHLWLSFSQVALALFVGLHYYDVSHLLANVSYVALYLAVFSVAITLKELGLEKAKKWGRTFFNFSVIFCLAQLLVQVYGAVSFGFLPRWIFDPTNGINILMFAFIIGGFFYVTASQLYRSEVVLYAGYFYFLIAYIVKLAELDVKFIEWYSLPIGLYLIFMGYLYQKSHPEVEILPFSNFMGQLIMLAPSTIAFMSAAAPSAQLHAVWAAVVSIGFLVVGVLGRIKVFFFGGVCFLAWNVLYQSWEFIYALPKWITIGGFGLILLLSGIYLERRKKEFLEATRKLKKAFIEDWK